ncbi:MAG: 3-dehydroquinate synthase [bacterium]|nr:3-dehydroquinate synthase [bacterium]
METRSFSVKVGGNAYPLTIGRHLEGELRKRVAMHPRHRIAVITDSRVGELWGPHIIWALRGLSHEPALLRFPAGERHKTGETVSALYDKLQKRRFGRDTLIMAFGGGVVGDIAGFVAATYQRGVPFIQVPTTLLAMVDSSVGGKVGYDMNNVKNLIGAFNQPRAVIVDLNFLSTLPKRQVLNGLFEAIKMSFIRQRRSLELARKLNLVNPLKTSDVLQEIVWRAVRLKAGVVQRDEKEQHERKILNFGHTVGHSIESLSGYRKPHGFCVALGMLVEARISERLGILSSNDADLLEKYLAAFGIHRSELRKYSIADILAATRSDKKTLGGQPHYILLNSIGGVRVDGGRYAHPVSDAVVKTALSSLRQ